LLTVTGPTLHARPATTVVLGYGSPLRRDDAAGRRVAEAVAGWDVPGVTAFEVHQLTPDLAEPIAAAGLAIFVDASAAPAADTVGVRPLAPAPTAGTMAHACDPSSLLDLAALLYGRHPEAWLVSIPAPDLGFGAGLSEAAERGVAEALAWIASRLGVEGEPCTRSA
jgi:hydrogenase maturation protease